MSTVSPQRKKLAPRNKNLIKAQIGKGKLSKNAGKLNVFKVGKSFIKNEHFTKKYIFNFF